MSENSEFVIQFKKDIILIKKIIYLLLFKYNQSKVYFIFLFCKYLQITITLYPSLMELAD